MFTKTDFIEFLDNPRHVWVQKNKPDEYRRFVTMQDQFVMKQGMALEKLVRQLFPKGVYVTETDEAAFTRTKELVKKKTPVIYQATAIHKDLLARADFLVHDPETQKWNLFEVKSSTDLKDEYLLDAGFQKIVFERTGISIGTVSVVIINNEYVREGEVDPAKLFIIHDVTKEIEGQAKTLESQIATALKVLASTKIDDTTSCYNPHSCPCPELCHPDLPEYSIYNIANIRKIKIDLFREQGITNIIDVPDNFPLSTRQRLQIEIATTNRRVVNYEAIEQSLATLDFPLYFLDYETSNPAIPFEAGYRPYQQIPFQFSVHRVDTRDTRPIRTDFLARNLDELGEPLLHALRKAIGDTGSVIVWNQTFEMGRNAELAAQQPVFRSFLESLNNRIYDLREVFSLGLYTDPKCKGSSSIKEVLPVLVPQLRYDDLAIREGGMAAASWYEMVFGNNSIEKKEKVYADLIEYCGMDTLAMVKIWDVLRGLQA